MNDRLDEIAGNVEALANLTLLSTRVRDNLHSAVFLLRQLGGNHDAVAFDVTALLDSINNVRNDQA